MKQAKNESFDDYLARFIRLSQYSTYSKHRDNEQWNTAKLIRGLKPIMNEKVAPRQLIKFDDAIEVCRIIESSLQYQSLIASGNKLEIVASEGTSRKRKNQNPWNWKIDKRGNHQRGREFHKTTHAREWLRCGKKHGDKPCLAGQNVCFKCGRPGHYAKECRQRAENSRCRNQGRVFAMTHEEACRSPDMIQGAIQLNGHLIQFGQVPLRERAQWLVKPKGGANCGS